MRVILFNLYPYRAFREDKRKRRIFAELGLGLVLGLALCYSIGNEFAHRVAEKQQFLSNLSARESDMETRVAHVQTMKDRVAVLDRQVKALKTVEEESLLASQWVSFLDQTVPANVSLTRLYVAKQVLYVNGFTDTVSSLAQWVEQMEAGNSLFKSVELVTVTEPGNEPQGAVVKRHVFEIKAQLRGGQ